MEIIEKILTYLGGITGVIAIVVAIGQVCGTKWLDWWFEKKNQDYQKEIDKDVQRYISDLEAKNKDIQSQLDMKLTLLQIKEQQLGSVRMSAIAETYEAMGKFTTEAHHLFSVFKPVGQESDEEIYNKLCEHGNAFIAIWNKHKLYFPKDISDMIYKMNKEVQINTNMFFTLKRSQSDKQYECVQQMSSYLPKVIESIERRFREVIGVETKSE